MPPGLVGEGTQTLMQLPLAWRRCQQRAHHAEAQMHPAFGGMEGGGEIGRGRIHASGDLPALVCAASGILCGPAHDPQLGGASSVDHGTKNRSSPSSGFSASAQKRSHSDHGSIASSTGGIRRARATRHNRSEANCSSHHCRHRSSVRRSTPSCSCSARTRPAVKPWRSAVSNTTINPA